MHLPGLVRASITAPNVVTVPNVQLLEVGVDWECSTGTFTWTPEDLIAAIASQQDPDVRTPILKLGHTDPRFDGEPALGRVVNLRLTNNSQTLVGDFVGVPAWLAEAMATMYPRRSIEGQFNYRTHGGNEWPFVLTACSLLGTMYPAISTLDDLRALWEGNPVLVAADPADDPLTIAASAPGCVTAMKGEDVPLWKRQQREARAVGVAASSYGAVDVGDIVDAFYDLYEADPRTYWWWVREVRVQPLELIVDDDDGQLYRVPVVIAADNTVTFGDPIAVAIQYIDVTTDSDGNQVAARARVPRSAEAQIVACSYASAAAAGRRHQRPPAHPAPAGGSTAAATGADTTSSATTDTQEVTPVDPETLALLGLPADATQEQIAAAVRSAVTPAPADETSATGEATAGAETVPTGETPPAAGGEAAPTTDALGTAETAPAADGADAPAPAPVAAGAALPPGMVVIDEATLAQLRLGSEVAIQARATQEAERRRAVLDRAQAAGKFPPFRRAHYAQMMAADPAGTTDLLDNRMAPGLVPVGSPVGYQGGDETTAAAASAYPASWKPVTPARVAGSVRVTVGKD